MCVMCLVNVYGVVCTCTCVCVWERGCSNLIGCYAIVSQSICCLNCIISRLLMIVSASTLVCSSDHCKLPNGFPVYSTVVIRPALSECTWCGCYPNEVLVL